jgi:hypothetical protein
MNKRFTFGAFLLCLSVVMMFGTVGAQNQRTGTSAASELLIPVGARDFAMGGSSLAMSSGVEAIHWNPAGISRMSGSAEAMFSSMSYLNIADIQVSYGAAVATFGGFGTFGLSIKSLDFGDIPLTTVEDPENRSGATFSPTYVTIGLTYGRQITDAASVGVTVKLINETIARVSQSGVAFDIGLQYQGLLDVAGLQLGIAVKNIGPEMKFEGSGLLRSAVSSEGNRPEQKYASVAAGFELPSLIDIGLSYTGKIQDDMSYAVSGSYANNNLYEDEYKIGAEYGITISDISLFARGGYSFIPQVTEASDKIFGATLGVGLNYKGAGTDVTLDFGYRKVKLFNYDTILSLKVGF